MGPVVMARALWIDASGGVAGDMLLGALVDVGVPLETLQAAVDAVLPRAARLMRSTVTRAGLRATKVDVELLPPRTSDDERDERPARAWSTIRSLLDAADLSAAVRAPALRTFQRLAEAEGRVHGLPSDEVHFHEVGAVDSIADIVGSCAGFAALDVRDVVLSPVALGTGVVRTSHGTLPVPVPAVLELARGWEVLPGADGAASAPGELATPTGLALVTTAAGRSGPMPPMRVLATGVGAGTRDRLDRANVVRLVLGTAPAGEGDAAADTTSAVLLETNVDDLDPRVWPDILARLLAAGALDAWLTPILMKKGRPAHTLHVLARPQDGSALADLVLTHTSTLGLRTTAVRRRVLDRSWALVDVLDGRVRVKVGHRDGHVVQATPEFEDVAGLAREAGLPVGQVLALAQSAAVVAGLVPSARWPRHDG
jgi:pyridinium-3,5-bisthiocarboxylic acid mononucleotide nickel chelatase